MAIGKRIGMALGSIRCLFMRHEPHRRRVRTQPSGQHLGYCRFCGTKIRRKGYNEWVRQDWREGDDEQE